MDSTKYVGMDVHTEAISVAVRNSAGKVIMENSRNEGEHHSGVHRRATRKCARNV